MQIMNHYPIRNQNGTGPAMALVRDDQVVRYTLLERHIEHITPTRADEIGLPIKDAVAREKRLRNHRAFMELQTDYVQGDRIVLGFANAGTFDQIGDDVRSELPEA